MLSRIDKKFGKLGFDKTAESPHGVYYEHDLGSFTHVIEIRHVWRGGGKHGYHIFSFDKRQNIDSLNDCIALTPKEAKLALKAVRYLKRKYRKEWRNA